ncbi:MAG: PHA/PHB synthase family protein [Gammaproteobacteria bacterium]
MSATLARIVDRSQRLVRDFVARQTRSEMRQPRSLDPVGAGGAFQEFLARLVSNPVTLLEAQTRFWRDQALLWHSFTQRALGADSSPIITPGEDDRRFGGESWETNPVFDYIKQSYLLVSRYAFDCVEGVEGLDAHSARKVAFWTRQFVDALSPTNFAVTNPEVLQRTMDTGGENLLKGLSNLLEDLEAGKGQLRIKMTAADKFELGENIAVTPGRIVYQNELMQLIQYTPSTHTVYKTPLLIIPPWINKYYILDLRPRNSFIKWAVDQGHTVFVISWVNPDERLANKRFEDYVFEGPLAALDAIEQATGEQRVNAIGYCLGGTLLATTLAYMKRTADERIKSATFFATMVDFARPGELGVFIDEEQLRNLEAQMKETGYLDGSEMAQTFNLMRANDLIWSFVINNYLMGKDPFPFDLLYWNSDSTRMPYTMHQFYLRNLYQDNLLREPDGIAIGDTPIDLRAIDTPTYVLSTREDHIAPWTSTYAATQLYSGCVRFVLSKSGHIAGVVNPPAAHKYGYWTNEVLPGDADEWLAGAERHDGSWWLDWKKWIRRYQGKKIAARQPGDGALDVIEDAPGEYVKVRAS